MFDISPYITLEVFGWEPSSLSQQAVNRLNF